MASMPRSTCCKGGNVPATRRLRPLRRIYLRRQAGVAGLVENAELAMCWLKSMSRHCARYCWRKATPMSPAWHCDQATRLRGNLAFCGPRWSRDSQTEADNPEGIHVSLCPPSPPVMGRCLPEVLNEDLMPRQRPPVESGCPARPRAYRVHRLEQANFHKDALGRPRLDGGCTF